MDNLFTIEVLNNQTDHKDLLIKFPGLVDLTLDTYYFMLAIAPATGIQATRAAVVSLLSYWLTIIEEATDGQIAYLPIDFSDQYTGCFKVCQRGESLVLLYGFSKREGWAVNPLDPGDYGVSITDFQRQSYPPHEVSKAAFVLTLRRHIASLGLPLF